MYNIKSNSKHFTNPLGFSTTKPAVTEWTRRWLLYCYSCVAVQN